MPDITATVVSENPLVVRVEGADLTLAVSGRSQLGEDVSGTLDLPGTYKVAVEGATVTQDPADVHLFTITA